MIFFYKFYFFILLPLFTKIINCTLASDIIATANIKTPKLLVIGVPDYVEMTFSGSEKLFKADDEELEYEISTLDISKNVIETYNNIIKLENIPKKSLLFERAPKIQIRLNYPGFNNPNAKYIKVKISDKKNKNYSFFEKEINSIWGWMAVIPSIITILLALFLRESLISLIIGLWAGTFIIYKYNPIISLLKFLNVIVTEGFSNLEHSTLIYFCFLIGGLLSMLEEFGGTKGIANYIKKIISTKKKSLIATYLIGIMTFFDDYASCLIAGSTMKENSNILKISKEKFSFVVDICSTASACLSFLSSWAVVELSYLVDGFKNLNIKRDPYIFLFSSIRFKFYPILILFFCFLVIILGKDFGPMLIAEEKANLNEIKDEILIEEGRNINSKISTKRVERWYNAGIPYIVIYLTILFGTYFNGASRIKSYESLLKEKLIFARENSLNNLEVEIIKELNAINYSVRSIISSNSVFEVLLWASFIGSLSSIILTISQGFSIKEIMKIWLSGTKTMVFPIFILLYSWSLASVLKDLRTAEYIGTILFKFLIPELAPTIIFIFAGIISFSLGSAWGSSAILFPLVIPLSHILKESDEKFMLMTSSSIISGSVWGVHLSPISDSCIMTSLICDINNFEHIISQGIYCLIVGISSILICTIPVGFSIYSEFTAFIVNTLFLLTFLYYFGSKNY